MSEDPKKPKPEDGKEESGVKKAAPESEASRTVLDIGWAYMLKTASVSEWYERFSRYARRSATEICLPALGWTGPFFDSSVQPAPAFLGSTDPLRRWVADARNSLGSEGTIWAKVIVECGFLKQNHLFLRNQFGIRLSQVCLVNPTVQSVMDVLLDEILDHGVDGVVFDITDVYPNSGATGLNEVGVNCFCDFCQDKMREQGFQLKVGDFIGPSSFMRTVLRHTDSGTSHIDPTAEMIKSRDATALLEEARVRGFVRPDDTDAPQAAERALEYCEARAAVTADGLRRLASTVRARGARSAAILGSVNFDQSQQVTLEHLARAPAADEVWVWDASERMADSLPLLCYLGSRSSYYLNSFFEVTEGRDDLLNLLGIDGFLDRLQETLKRAASMNELSPASVFSGGLSPQYRGVVGVPVFQEEHLELVEDLTKDITGHVLPRAVLDRFRVAAGPAALSSTD